MNLLAPDDTVAREGVARVRRLVSGPIRLGLVGRVSSGKSTLVNAIVGRKVAATAAQECTRLVTSYHYASPETALLVTSTGRREPLSLSFIENPNAIDQALREGESAQRLEVGLQSQLLHDVSLVDTPGVESTSRDAGPVVQEALRGVEVLLLLFRGAIRQDDSDLVDLFHAASGGATPWAESAVGLLSHADNFGAGTFSEIDPIDAAQESANALMTRLPGRFSRIAAVAPLLAQAVRTGDLRERDAHEIRSWASVDDSLLPFLGAIDLPGVDNSAVQRLSAIIGPYGLHRGVTHAGSAEELLGWLDRRSGVSAVMDHIRDQVVPMVHHQRAARCLAELTGLTRGHGRERAAILVERASLSADFDGVRELAAYRNLVRDLPNHPLRYELEALMRARDMRGRLEVLAGLTGRQPSPDTALARAGQYQAVSSMARRGAEAEAARTLARSMANLAAAMTGGR